MPKSCKLSIKNHSGANRIFSVADLTFSGILDTEVC